MGRNSSLGSLFRRSKSLGSPTGGGSSPMIESPQPQEMAQSPQTVKKVRKNPCAKIFKKRQTRERWPMELHYNGKLSSFYAAKASAVRAILFNQENYGVERRLNRFLEKRKVDTRYTTGDDEHILYKMHYSLLKAQEMNKTRQRTRCALLEVLEMVAGF